MHGFSQQGTTGGAAIFTRVDGPAAGRVIVGSDGTALWAVSGPGKQGTWKPAATAADAFAAAAAALAVAAIQRRMPYKLHSSETRREIGVDAGGEIKHRKGCAPRAFAAFEGRDYEAVCSDLQAIAKRQGRRTDFVKCGTFMDTILAYCKQRGLQVEAVQGQLKKCMAANPNSVLITPRHAIAVIGGQQVVFGAKNRGYRRGSIEYIITRPAS